MSDLNPKYTVTKKDGDFEIRKYSPIIIAQTKVKSTFTDASSDGFDILVKYISKENAAKSKIQMTAPVVQKGQKIKMTSPFITKIKDIEDYEVSFIMPSNYTMETLPTPVDNRVELKQIDSKTYVCLKFRGKIKDALVVAKTQELEQKLNQHNLQSKSPVELWRFDPPFNFGFLQRNIIAVEV